jgi:hypothetical protein
MPADGFVAGHRCHRFDHTAWTGWPLWGVQGTRASIHQHRRADEAGLGAGFRQVGDDLASLTGVMF